MNRQFVLSTLLVLTSASAASPAAPVDDQRLLALVCATPEDPTPGHNQSVRPKGGVTAKQLSMQLWGSADRTDATTTDMEFLRGRGLVRQGTAVDGGVSYFRMIGWTNMASKMFEIPLSPTAAVAKADVAYLSSLCAPAWKAPDTGVWCSGKQDRPLPVAVASDSFCAAYHYYQCTTAKQQASCKKLPWALP